MSAEKKDISFSKNIKENKRVKEYLTEDEIEFCLKPNNYIGHSHEIIERVLDSINA